MTAGRTALSSGADMRGHVLRYRLAAGFVEPGDTVVDAACGTGYGAEIMPRHCDYLGLDVDLSELEVEMGERRRFERVDLSTEEALNVDDFDVFVGFETMEHLDDYSHWVQLAKSARKWILVSVPVVPTTHDNPHHRHDFGPGEAAAHFVDGEWDLYQTVAQPSEFSEICVFQRSGAAWS